MNIAVGISSLIAVAVLGGVTGLPEQKLKVNHQIKDMVLKSALLDDHHERQDPCNTRKACKDLGGVCQPKGEACNGVMKFGKKFCRNFEDCGCCAPYGCTFGSTTCPSGAFLNTSTWDYCAIEKCNAGVWEVIEASTCVPDEVSCPCEYNPVYAGCILSFPNLPHFACNCTLHDIQIGGTTTINVPYCTGTIVHCDDPTSFFCTTPGTGEGHCLQALGSGGNCVY